MEILKGSGKTEFGPGVQINLTGDEVAQAILMVNYVKPGGIYVDPSASVISNEYVWNGRDGIKKDNNYYK